MMWLYVAIVISGLSLLVGGIWINRARTPPAAYIGMVITGFGGILAASIAIAWIVTK